MTVPNADSAEPTFTGQVVLGHYHVVLPLGRGGQGLVHLARAEGAAGVARPVVIKRVHAPLAQDKQTRERFILEARIMARLRHPDIVSIVEFEREGDDSYLMVLEYVHGYDLWRWARFVQAQGQRLAPKLIAYVGTRVLDALHYSHSLRDPDGTPTPVIHRDVSAGNVLIDVTGQVKLTDFGIAWMARESSVLGEPGIYGKLGYIAPELFRGASPSPASDVYACGVMLHALLLGSNEFQAFDLATAKARAFDHVPTRIDTVCTEVGSAAGDVIERALEKHPQARFESAAAFSAELRRAFQLDLAEVRDEFAAKVAQDFESPAFSQYMNVLSLRHIDAAWRRQDADASSRSLRPTNRPPRLVTTQAGEEAPAENNDAGQPEPRADSASVPVAEEGSRRRRFEALGWSVAVALLVALVFTMIGMQARKGTESRVLYVEAQPAAAPASEPAAPPKELVAPEPLPAPAAAPEVEPSASAKREEPLLTSGVQLTARFARQRAEVSRCFRDHRGEQAGKLSVVFEIDPRGHVQHAELSPPELSDSGLGRCLLAVSRATRFGRQSGYLRFRIPISAQTSHEKP